MSGDYKIAARVGWPEFILVILIVVGGITGLVVFGNANPDMMSVPIALGALAAIVVLCTMILMLKNRKRILSINQSGWTVKDAKSGKELMKFDFSRPYCLGFAIRQGLIGKYGKIMFRTMQVFVSQDSQILKLESAYLEEQSLKGNYDKEWLADVKPPSHPILTMAAGKAFTYDEPQYLHKQGKLGMAAYGLPSFMVCREEELFKSALWSAEQNLKRNVLASRLPNIANDDFSYSEFEKEFMTAASS